MNSLRSPWRYLSDSLFAGASVGFEEVECRYCGEAIAIQSRQHQNRPSSQHNQEILEQQNQSLNTQIDSRYIYLKPYYQNEFSKIDIGGIRYKGKWNWSAFFFTWIWAFSKGLWLIATITLIVNLILLAMEIPFIGIGIGIFFGVKGNYLYYNLIKNGKQLP